MRKRVLLILAIIVAAMLFNLYPDQSLKAQSRQRSLESANLINITGKIIKAPDGYYIQRQIPLEIFRILNPIPERLDKIVKSGKLVEIEAQSVQGDNVVIKKINGKTY